MSQACAGSCGNYSGDSTPKFQTVLRVQSHLISYAAVLAANNHSWISLRRPHLCDLRQHAQPGQNLASALRMRAAANMRPSTTPTTCAVRLSLITADIIRLAPRSGGSGDRIFALLVKHCGTDTACLSIKARDWYKRRARELNLAVSTAARPRCRESRFWRNGHLNQ